jgi:hypothetical protein
MSKTCLWNSVAQPNKSCWDLVTEMVELGWTCPVKVTGTQLGTRVSPVDMRIKRAPNMSDKCLWNPDKYVDMSDFSRKLVWKIFLMICTSPTHSVHPLDSTELLGHK